MTVPHALNDPAPSKSGQSMEKSLNYYSSGRKDILPLLEPIVGKTVLDIGCGAGGTGRLLKERGCAALYGIECIPKAAEIAMQAYDKVHLCPVEQVDFTQYRNFFDYIICADVLEHLVDPWSVVETLRETLKPGGSLIASIPNTRNRGIIGGLLLGSWEYQSAGLLDKTHLRFFTFQSVVSMFYKAGYTITSIGPNYESVADEIVPKLNSSPAKKMIEELIKVLVGQSYTFTDEDMLDLFTIQFLVKAERKKE